MKSFSRILTKVKRIISQNQPIATYWFRGQADSEWELEPGLARVFPEGKDEGFYERSLYYEFRNRAGNLIPENASSWQVLFYMQHHGMYTRLLDWTESFGIALYFALNNANEQAAIFILDCKRLNSDTYDNPGVLTPDDLNGSYYDYFVKGIQRFEADVIALGSTHFSPRMMRQNSYFTLHGDLGLPLEILHPEATYKITIDKEAFSQAHQFLELAGINEFSLFPDLDGLARQISSEMFISTGDD